MNIPRILTLLLVCTALSAGVSSCKLVRGVVHDGQVVAQAGGRQLYASEVAAYIPDGLTQEDSTRLAQQYINTWAQDAIVLLTAEQELSKEEKNVTDELEQYRRALLRYRYEQKYVNQRLDTTMTTAQVEAYYEEHKSSFVLDAPVMKARFLRISKNSPSVAVLRRKMASSNPSDLLEADSIAFHSAKRFTYYDDRWIGAVVLSREFGEDFNTLLSSMKGGYIEREDPVSGELSFAYIAQMLKKGEQGPVEYYEPRIRDAILSARKQSLLVTLERDLLDKARKDASFVVY